MMHHFLSVTPEISIGEDIGAPWDYRIIMAVTGGDDGCAIPRLEAGERRGEVRSMGLVLPT
jgi:hypothetical protein